MPDPDPSPPTPESTAPGPSAAIDGSPSSELASSAKKKKEGWQGIALTALLCSLFLWVWFRPEKLDPAQAAVPQTWLQLAIEEQKHPTNLAEQYDRWLTAVLLAEAGEETLAAQAAEGVTAFDLSGLAQLAAPASAGGEVEAMEGQNLSAVHGAGLNLSTLMPEAWRAVGLEALQAADVADIPRAQSLLAEATRRATANGCHLLHLAAVQFQCGLASEAVETLEKAKASALDQVSAQERLHGWRHLAQVDAVAPVLTWADSHPEDAPPLLKELTLRAHLVAKMRLSSDLWTLGSVYVPGGTSERSVRVQQTTDGDLGAAWYEINRLRSHSARSADFLVICRTLLTLRWLEGNLAPTTSRSS